MSPPGVDWLRSKRKLIDEDTTLMKKVRTSSRQMITPSAMPDDDDNSDEDEKSNEKTPDTKEMPDQHEKTGLGTARTPIKLKLFRKAPQTDDIGVNATTKGVNEYTFREDEKPANAIYESSRGRLLRRQLDNSHGPKQDDLDVDIHDDMSSRQVYWAGTIAHEDDEILGHARARRRSFKVEAEDYDDWERFVGAEEDDYHEEYEDNEGDEDDKNADGEEDEHEDDEAVKPAARGSQKFLGIPFRMARLY